MSAQVYPDETPSSISHEFVPKRKAFGTPNLDEPPYSVAEAILQWGDSSEDGEVARTFDTPGTLEAVVAAVQEVFDASGYEWLSPSQTVVLARNTGHKVMLLCEVAFVDEGGIAITAKLLAGNEDFFEKVVDELEGFLKTAVHE
jgi:hypothetical protein